MIRIKILIVAPCSGVSRHRVYRVNVSPTKDAGAIVSGRASANVVVVNALDVVLPSRKATFAWGIASVPPYGKTFVIAVRETKRSHARDNKIANVMHAF